LISIGSNIALSCFLQADKSSESVDYVQWGVSFQGNVFYFDSIPNDITQGVDLNNPSLFISQSIFTYLSDQNLIPDWYTYDNEVVALIDNFLFCEGSYYPEHAPCNCYSIGTSFTEIELDPTIVDEAFYPNLEDDFIIVPNPAVSQIEILFADPVNQPRDLMIYDISGRLVRALHFDTSEKLLIEIEALHPGIYTVLIPNLGTSQFVVTRY
jgi:hypothetical protein